MYTRIERVWLILRQFRKKTPRERYLAIKRRLWFMPKASVARFVTNRRILRLIRFEQAEGGVASPRTMWQRLRARWGRSMRSQMLSHPETTGPVAAERIVAISKHLGCDPLTLVSMAQHPLSASKLARVLAEERAAPLSDVDERLTTRADYAAAFLVATALTGDDDAIDHACARIHNVVNEHFLQIVESFGQRPAASAEEVEPLARGLRHSGLRGRKRHRLVIAENFKNPESFLPLLRGAERVTLLGLDDTFGKAAFADYRDLPDTGEIIVEHIRSRVTRFSPHYVEAHSQTRDAAIELAAIADSVSGLVPPGDLPHLELAIADHLFFQLLRLRAIEELLVDPDFDHIVIATDEHKPTSGYILTLAGVEGLTRDPRVELVSLARTFSKRMGFAALLPAIMTGPQPRAVPEAWLPPTSELAAQLWRNAKAMSTSLPDRAVAERGELSPEDAAAAGSVLMMTTSNAAYDFSTARYTAALSKRFPTAIAICGGSASAIQREMSTTDAGQGRTPYLILRRDYVLSSPTAFSRWMQGQISQFCARRGRQDKVAHIISCGPERLAANIIQSQILHGQVTDIWFSRMAKADGLPDAIALSAARTPAVSLFMSAARRHGVPTLLLEAHGLNANYCRYAKVGADYYGVISGHFRTDAEKGFAIDGERIKVLGTPRIIASASRDHHVARAEVAAQLGHNFPQRKGGVITFFSQPSNWAHVSEVWRLVLAAAQKLNLQVLLKTHPEETASRVMLYQAIAREMQAAGRVQLVNCNANLLIEASDVVLTGYSAAALDAAVMGRPIVCVTVNGAAYPVDQHEIARAPLVTDLPELIAALRKRLKASGDKAYAAFLAAEPQFVSGPDEALCGFMAEILDNPSIRPAEELPKHLFIDPPHPTYTI